MRIYDEDLQAFFSTLEMIETQGGRIILSSARMGSVSVSKAREFVALNGRPDLIEVRCYELVSGSMQCVKTMTIHDPAIFPVTEEEFSAIVFNAANNVVVNGEELQALITQLENLENPGIEVALLIPIPTQIAVMTPKRARSWITLHGVPNHIEVTIRKRDVSFMTPDEYGMFVGFMAKLDDDISLTDSELSEFRRLNEEQEFQHVGALTINVQEP